MEANSIVSIVKKLSALRERAGCERGQAFVLFAAGLVGFMGLVGMSVDIGRLVYTKAELQKSADAAALAAAQDLPSTDTATTTANSYISKNGGGDTSTVAFSKTVTTNDTVTVTVGKHVPYFFLKVVGIDGGDPSATAKAKADTNKITGYTWTNVAPFVIWGGNRKNEVHPGDASCPLHTCAGKSYTFLDTNWMNASGSPDRVASNPDWTANESNNFKGDIHHGAGNPVSQIGETFSEGGLGDVTPPAPGSIIVIPIVSKASGNSDLRTFTIGAWAVIKVDTGCDKQHCSGTIQSSSTNPPAGWDTGGNTPPPTGLDYNGTTIGLLQ